MKVFWRVIGLLAVAGVLRAGEPAAAPTATPAPATTDSFSLDYHSDNKVSLQDARPSTSPVTAADAVEGKIAVTVAVDETYEAAAWITKVLPLVLTVKNNSEVRVTLLLHTGSTSDVTIYGLPLKGGRRPVEKARKVESGSVREEVLGPGDSCTVDAEMPFAAIDAKMSGYQASVLVEWDLKWHTVYSREFAAPKVGAEKK